MSAHHTYITHCVDETSGQVGCFVFDRLHYMQAGRFRAQSPIFESLKDLFAWDRKNGTALCFQAYTPDPSNIERGNSMANIYGVVDTGGIHTDISKTERGAKSYATRHGFSIISTRNVNSYNVTVIAEKHGKKWRAV